MNDRFKFRVFDSNKIMTYLNGFAIPDFVKEGDGELNFVGLQGGFGGQVKGKLKDLQLMQCVGLKDKNGKLIYEGDILRVFGDPEDYGGYTGHDYIEFVEWWEDTRGFGLSEGHGLDEGWNLEIIGNIHENKELINNES